MATATLKKQKTKATVPGWHSNGTLEEDRSASFFMPAGMSLDEFRKWSSSDEFPQNGLIAFIGREIFVDMSPERLKSHGSVKTAICATLAHMVLRKNKGKFYFDRTRIVNVAAKVSNEPDGLFASWASFKGGKIRDIPSSGDDDFIELEGTPDWVLEIVSPSSVTKDKKKLRKRYHRAGILEYWLIDARGKDVDFQILRHGESGYEPVERDSDWQRSLVFGKKFRLRRIEDELGGIDYRLDMK
jgi:Uma2 family endonuclease